MLKRLLVAAPHTPLANGIHPRMYGRSTLPPSWYLTNNGASYETLLNPNARHCERSEAISLLLYKGSSRLPPFASLRAGSGLSALLAMTSDVFVRATLAAPSQRPGHFDSLMERSEKSVGRLLRRSIFWTKSATPPELSYTLTTLLN